MRRTEKHRIEHERERADGEHVPTTSATITAVVSADRRVESRQLVGRRDTDDCTERCARGQRRLLRIPAAQHHQNGRAAKRGRRLPAQTRRAS